MKVRIVNPNKYVSKIKVSKQNNNISKTNNLKGENEMKRRSGTSVVKRTVRRKKNPVVFANRRKSIRRRRNPKTFGSFSVSGITDTLMQGLIAGAGAMAVKFVTDKYFTFENVWLRYLAMAGAGLGAGYIAGTFNKNIGKQISIGAITLLAVQILNDQFLSPKLPPMLKGEMDDSDLQGLTLGEISELSDNNLLGAYATSSSGGVDRMVINNNSGYSEDPYQFSNAYGMP